MKNTDSIKKITIVGAGISGLVSGIYAQKNGYISEIYERNPNAGGLCMAWVRKGYNIDGCIHWMTGTKEGTEINEMWKYVDAFDQEDIIYDDNFGSVEIDGTVITFWNDINKLENELLAIAPMDKRIIHRWMSLLKKIFNVPLPMQNSVSSMNIWRKILLGIHMFPYLPVIIYCLSTSNAKFAKKFKSPILRKAVNNVLPGDKANLYQMVYAYGTCVNGNGGVPKGGSLALINRLVDNYKELGGVIHANSEVDRIIVNNGKAVGIRLENGQEIYSDYVITSTDIHVATKKLLRGEYVTHRFNHRDKNINKYCAPSCVLASYSVSLEKYQSLGITSTYQFDIPALKVGNHYVNNIRVRSYQYDPTFIKDGRVLINVLVHQDDVDFPFWSKLKENYKEYNKYKNEVGNAIKQLIEDHFTSLKDDIELLDVVTPMTFVRYTNAYHGAYMPWALTHNNSMLIHNGKIRGVDNLFVSGQWLQMPGGIPIALATGKYSIDRINKKEGKFKFVKPVKRVNTH